MIVKKVKSLLLPFALILKSIIALSALAQSKHNDSLSFEFKKGRDMQSYEILAEFYCSNPNISEVKSLIYEPENVKKVVSDAKIEILTSETDRHILLYRYKKAFYSIEMGFERTLNDQENKISFVMTSFKKSGGLPVPDIISSSGSYLITQRNGITYVEYRQTTKTSQFFLKKQYLDMIEEECRQYLVKLASFVNEMAVP